MQQASLATPDSTSVGGKILPSSFVINLCASTTPVALTHPNHPALSRFTFFVSRRREEGRERFRLHMGYFSSQEEAERLLEVVREIYPAAWAGSAPGQRLRAAAVAASASASIIAPAGLDDTASPPAVASAPAAPLVAAMTPAPAFDLPAEPLAPEPLMLSLLPDEGRPNAPTSEATATMTMSNVREAIAALDDSPAPPLLRPIPDLMPTAAAALDNAAALRLLESSPRRSALPSAKERPVSTEVASYAVQLMWSVQPIEIAKVPQLAIFGAYTLYGAEGNRGGRRWYGLRLGFFTDAISAKQVAQYLRSEFSAVSVVPVTAREREHARIATSRPAAPMANIAVTPTASGAAKASLLRQDTGEFKFIDDRQPSLPTAAAKAASGPPGKRARLVAQRSPTAGRPKSGAMTLEETLEILGAGQLEMDNGRGASINDSGVPRAQLQAAKSRPSRLGRLLERLSERLSND